MFQPRSASFQQEVGEDIRGVLEGALLQHSCLTRGDWLAVPHGGQRYDLRICDLHPEAAVSVIDTDLEAEINPSIETEERIREEYEAATRRAAEAALAAAAAVAEAEAEAAAQEEERLRREALRRAKEAALPAEPSPGAAEPCAACLFRFPDGSRHSRRFPLDSPLQVGSCRGAVCSACAGSAAFGRAECGFCCCLGGQIPGGQIPRQTAADATPPSTPAASPLHVALPLPQLLFDFVDSKGASGMLPGRYSLVTQYPRRVFLPSLAEAGAEAAAAERQLTLHSAGLTGPREVLFLEQQHQLQQQPGIGDAAGGGS